MCLILVFEHAASPPLCIRKDIPKMHNRITGCVWGIETTGVENSLADD
jgi:hypothetical protein